MRPLPRVPQIAGVLSLAGCLAIPIASHAQTIVPDGPRQPADTLATSGGAATSSPALERMPGLAQLFRPLGTDLRRMGSNRNVFLAGVGTAGSLAAHRADMRIAASGWGGEAATDMFAPGRIVGDFLVQTGGALATYSVGRLTGSARVASIGAQLFRAGLLSQGTTQIIKFSAGRTRPDGTARSFPSGHTASAFATASVLQTELGWKAGVPAYAVAAWVAASRVQMERHYLSDVIAGATIGLLAGRAVTLGAGPARFAVSPMIVPGGAGASFVHVTNR